MDLAERAAAVIRSQRRLFVSLLIVVAAGVWCGAGASAWWIKGVVSGLPGASDVREIAVMAQATTLYDVKGRTAFTIYKEQRIPVSLDRVSPHLVQAILAVEDQRFYEHGGLDVVRIAGALVQNVRSGRATQGASTLTQQLARQSFLTAEKTYGRKMKEAIVAARIEREFDKREILQLYLNKVYFGDGLYGAEAASLGYFAKPAADLTLPEAALLAGLVKSPSTYAPTVDLDRAVARRKVVLQAMHDARVIDQKAYDAALKSPVELSDGLRSQEPFGQYFKEEVRKELVQRFGWERVYEGGLKVHTTLDLDLQKTAETEVSRGLQEIEQRQLRRKGKEQASPEPLQAALVAMDPATGEVRAMVGGRDFQSSRFNRVTQAKRQAGSAFKPFVYAAALEHGFSPGTVLTDLDDPVWTPQGDWVPEDGHSTATSMTMRAALKNSSNRAAVRMLREVGIPTAVTFADRLGVGPVPAVPSLVLGSGEVTLMSMTAAFAAFANDGLLPAASLITRVEDADGQVLFRAQSSAHRAISETTAFLMSNMLADVVNSGTAWSARRVGFTLPAAGKTGTTNDYRDAWFVGYTPKIVAGVWVGYDMPQTIISNGYAAELAVPIWAKFMKTATRNHEPAWFKTPSGLTSARICRLSGALATDSCRNAVDVDNEGNVTDRSTVYTEYFIRGTEPRTFCPIHDAYEDRSWWRIFAGGRDERPAAPARDDVVERRSDDRRSDDRRSDERAAAEEAVQPAGVTGGILTSAETQASPAPEPKKRGFWSRIFGRRRDESPKTEPPTPPQAQPVTPRAR
jgi:penicillin-binding protein 1A